MHDHHPRHEAHKLLAAGVSLAIASTIGINSHAAHGHEPGDYPAICVECAAATDLGFRPRVTFEIIDEIAHPHAERPHTEGMEVEWVALQMATPAASGAATFVPTIIQGRRQAPPSYGRAQFFGPPPHPIVVSGY